MSPRSRAPAACPTCSTGSRSSFSRTSQTAKSERPRLSATSRAPIHEANRVAFYTSHEGLHLPYEQAQTRFIERQRRWYNLSTHMPWIGMRTAALDGAHVEFFRGISNPVGIKVGPSMSAEWVQGLIAALNPRNEPGRLVLIHRMGIKDIDKGLAPLVQTRTWATTLNPPPIRRWTCRTCTRSTNTCWSRPPRNRRRPWRPSAKRRTRTWRR